MILSGMVVFVSMSGERMAGEGTGIAADPFAFATLFEVILSLLASERWLCIG